MNTMLDHTTDGERRGEEKRVSNLQSPSLDCLPTFEFKHILFFLNFGILYSQLELCGGLTPISERSTRASCDDTDSHTQVSLLAEAGETNTNTCYSEDNSIIQPRYITTVCHTTQNEIQ